MKSKGEIILVLSIILLAILLGFLIGLAVDKNVLWDNLDITRKVPVSEQEIINNCMGLSVEKTSFCLRDNVETFYNYEITLSAHEDLETLKKEGGDCYNYAMFYVRMAKQLGFQSDYRRYDGEDGVFSGHRMAMIWNEEDDDYCKLDLLEVSCRNKNE